MVNPPGPLRRPHEQHIHYPAYIPAKSVTMPAHADMIWKYTYIAVVRCIWHCQPLARRCLGLFIFLLLLFVPICLLALLVFYSFVMYYSASSIAAPVLIVRAFAMASIWGDTSPALCLDCLIQWNYSTLGIQIHWPLRPVTWGRIFVDWSGGMSSWLFAFGAFFLVTMELYRWFHGIYSVLHHWLSSVISYFLHTQSCDTMFLRSIASVA